MNPRAHRVDLKLNTQDIVRTDLIAVQYDNKSVEFKFYISDVEGESIDYSQLAKATMISKMADGTYAECQCDINTDHISYLICYDETNVVGAVVSEVALYGNNEEHVTTQKFQYIVIPTLAIGVDPHDDANLLILQQLILDVIALENEVKSKEELRLMAETIRVDNELERIANEILRAEAEGNREIVESLRVQAEILRVEAEELRKQTEILRNQAIEEIKSEFETMNVKINQLTVNSICQMILYEVDELSEGILEESIFRIPMEYDYDISHVTLISHGEAVGISDVNTCEISLVDEDNVVIADAVFDDVNLFPNQNLTCSLAVEPDFITENSLVKIKVENSVGVSTPKFLLQINYVVRHVV